MRRLVLVRHGETEWNRTGRLQGRADIPLNETGLEQADAAARTLTGHLRDGTTIVASPQSRAKATADALSIAARVPVVVDERLVERAYGEWEGLTGDERRAHTVAYAEWEAGREPALAGYESHGDVALRMREALNYWFERVEGDVVFVTHGSAARMVILALLDLPLRSRGVGNLANASWSVLAQHGDGQWSLLEHNVKAPR